MKKELENILAKNFPYIRKDLLGEIRRLEDSIFNIDLFLSAIGIGIMTSLMVQSLFPPQQWVIFIISLIGFFASCFFVFWRRSIIKKEIKRLNKLFDDSMTEWLKKYAKLNKN